MVQLFERMAWCRKVAMQKRKPAFCVGWPYPNDSDWEMQDISQTSALGIAAVRGVRRNSRRLEVVDLQIPEGGTSDGSDKMSWHS